MITPGAVTRKMGQPFIDPEMVPAQVPLAGGPFMDPGVNEFDPTTQAAWAQGEGVQAGLGAVQRRQEMLAGQGLGTLQGPAGATLGLGGFSGQFSLQPTMGDKIREIQQAVLRRLQEFDIRGGQ